MIERIRELADSAAKYSAVMAMKSDESANELFVEHLVLSVVQECIQQLEIGKKCDPYTGELFTCEHNDNIDYEIEVLKDHFGLELPEKFQTHVHAVNTSQERVNKTAKNEHEGWYGQWQWQCGYERGWDKAMEREWVGLSDEEISGVWQKAMVEDNGKHARLDNQPFVHFARAIEAKLKDKNT